MAQTAANPKSPARAIVTNIQLSAIRVGKEMRWYYLVSTYNIEEADEDTPPESHDLLILMNGTVVQPTEEPSHGTG